MSEDKIRQIAEDAKIIINGYSFTNGENDFVKILSLNHPECAMVVNKKCEIIETNMDEIEQKIVLELAQRNIKLLEEIYA